jgi:hypothetical protein
LKNSWNVKCLKWAHMTHLNIYNTSYGQKKGQESKCQFASCPLKINNCFEIGVYKWHVTYFWKFFNKGYNFALNFTLIRGLHKKMAFQSVKNLNFESFETPHLGSPRTRWHLDAAHVVNHREYYWSWFPPSMGRVESCEFVYARAPKMLQPRINQVVILFVQVYMNNWHACHLS